MHECLPTRAYSFRLIVKKYELSGYFPHVLRVAGFDLFFPTFRVPRKSRSLTSGGENETVQDLQRSGRGSDELAELATNPEIGSQQRMQRDFHPRHIVQWPVLRVKLLELPFLTPKEAGV